MDDSPGSFGGSSDSSFHHSSSHDDDTRFSGHSDRHPGDHAPYTGFDDMMPASSSDFGGPYKKDTTGRKPNYVGMAVFGILFIMVLTVLIRIVISFAGL